MSCKTREEAADALESAESYQPEAITQILDDIYGSSADTAGTMSTDADVDDSDPNSPSDKPKP